MTDLRKAAEMALEALENADFIVDMADAHYGIEPEDRLQLIETLRTALAQPEQANPIDTYERAYYEGKRAGIAESEAIKTQSEQEPVAWQFYQDGRWHDGMYLHNHRKNTEADGYPVRDLYTAPPKQPEQEPVAWMYPSDLKTFETNEATATAFSIKVGCTDEVSVPLYTAPPSKPWVSLTDEEIKQVYRTTIEHVTVSEAVMCRAIARAIEAALRSKNNG